MLTTRLIVRVLDGQDGLLAWAEVLADARGDGKLWPCKPQAQAWVEETGTPAKLSVHWADVNVEVRTAFTARPVTQGEVLTLTFEDRPLMIVGPMPGPLPPVTVRTPVAVNVPVGSMGAVGAR